MSVSIDLSEIKSLSVPERMLVVEQIWDSIADEQEALPITQAQRDELDRRLKDAEQSPDEGEPWEQVKAELRTRG